MQKELEDIKEDIRHMRANAERDLQHYEVVFLWRSGCLAPLPLRCLCNGWKEIEEG